MSKRKRERYDVRAQLRAIERIAPQNIGSPSAGGVRAFAVPQPTRRNRSEKPALSREERAEIDEELLLVLSLSDDTRKRRLVSLRNRVSLPGPARAAR